MTSRTDALIVGAGPAGAAAAILLARAGWRVVLVEQDEYPRRKVCGECLSAATLAILDDLGVGKDTGAHAGPELRQIGWMSGATNLTAAFPQCRSGPYRYGRALRRDFLDAALVDRARAQGVAIVQPAKVRAVRGGPGAFQCELRTHSTAQPQTLDATVVIDAHGSWQSGPRMEEADPTARQPLHSADLFAFKAVFEGASLPSGLLPVIALPGGYGGMVMTDCGFVTLAFCLRRDALAACRASQGASAGEAVEALLRQRVLGVNHALQGARRMGPWLSVGPLRTGSRVFAESRLLRIGNAAGESHPLIGEGIAMALQSAVLLTQIIAGHSPAAVAASHSDLQRRYAAAWHRAFNRRLRMAAAYAHIAMQPALTGPTGALLRGCPALLTLAARLAGKNLPHVSGPTPGAIVHEYT